MKVNHIYKVNEAITTLRHFIDLSAQLLPYLIELKFSNRDDSEDEELKQINHIFENYTFDNRVSQLLMNSSIVETIENSYHYIMDVNHSKMDAKRQLHNFRKEHRRLRKNWDFIDSN